MKPRLGAISGSGYSGELRVRPRHCASSKHQTRMISHTRRPQRTRICHVTLASAPHGYRRDGRRTAPTAGHPLSRGCGEIFTLTLYVEQRSCSAQAPTLRVPSGLQTLPNRTPYRTHTGPSASRVTTAHPPKSSQVKSSQGGTVPRAFSPTPPLAIPEAPSRSLSCRSLGGRRELVP